MALKKVDIFCPDCKDGGDLWVYPRRCFEVECRNCKKKWEYNELKEICTMLVKKAKADRSFQYKDAIIFLLAILLFTGGLVFIVVLAQLALR